MPTPDDALSQTDAQFFGHLGAGMAMLGHQLHRSGLERLDVSRRRDALFPVCSHFLAADALLLTNSQLKTISQMSISTVAAISPEILALFTKGAVTLGLIMASAAGLNAAGRVEEDAFMVELYRKQIETICTGYLRSSEATKQSGNGHLYFVPRTFMAKVDAFETFITLLNQQNQNDAVLTVNSFYIIDDAKQRDKMAEEFYLAVKKEIAEYQDKADYFIKSGCQSPAVLERWALKIGALEEKKRHYEDVLRRELTGLDDEFSTLQFLGQELSARANDIRFRKAA